MPLCPCGSNRDFVECCGPIIAGTPAPTAEALVRSRYTAFVYRTLDHVERTHAPEVRDDFNRAEAERLAEECEWLGLEIRSATETSDTAEVDFVIRVRCDNQDLANETLSRFRRDNGQWLFVSSKPVKRQRRVIKIGPNDPCPCKSGKKAKKCCGATTKIV
jgi:SEC-C motif-containing protein